MAMQDKLVIDGTDLTEYRLSWNFQGDWDASIDSLTITLSNSVKTVKSITAGMIVTLTRGFVTDLDEDVFDGQITQVKPFATKITLTCKSQMYDAVKSGRTKSWDKDIDTENGVGSEIFKSLCDNSGLDYDDTTIINTGTLETQKINKFIQNDEDDFQKMNELGEYYNYIVSYDYSLNKVIFKPKGYTIYPKSLLVGTDIPGQINWTENMEQLINKVKIQGATVYDKIVQTFAGPATEFTLSKTPEDTELRKNHSTTDDLLTRGQKGIGTLGIDHDYYVDVEQKKIVVASNISDVWINYGAQVPLPIILSDFASINKYGGPNKIPHFKKITLTDIKDKDDAEKRGRALLSKYSTPFYRAEKIPVINSTIETYGVVKVGDIVSIEDSYTNLTLNVFVSTIYKSWPHVYDLITVGDEIWRTEDWQATQMKKINQLFNELNKNQDILIQTFDINKTIPLNRRYVLASKKDRSSDGTNVFILGHSVFGKLGTQKLGESSAVWEDYSLIPGNNIYRDFLLDDVFEGTITGTGNWNTSTNQLEFNSGDSISTGKITYGIPYTYFTVKLESYTGTITVEISGDNGSTWQTVTLNTRTAFTSFDNSGVLLRFTESGSSTATIANLYDADDSYLAPALYCKFEA